MKCENCKVVIGSEFSHAIKNNQCPACGGGIMKHERLASYLSLRSLLDSNIVEKGIDTEKIASLIVANFEVKQLFKEELKKPDEEGITDSVTMEEEISDEDPDAESKAAQKVEAKEILKGMRDEVLSGALQDRYGFGDEDSLLLPDEDAGMHEIINKHKQDNSRNAVAMGTGPVRRREP